MDNFKDKLLKTKLISIWGAGYLGYTKLIRLLSRGFKANIFDVTGTGFARKIRRNEYPAKRQIYSWSESGNIPPVDISKIYTPNAASMFTSCVHILAFPLADQDGMKRLERLAGIFISNSQKARDSLVVFQSVGSPGTINKHFISVLREKGTRLSYATAFRSDWTIEEFLNNNKKRVLAADDRRSLEKITFFYDILGTKYKILSSIKEAELYENAKNSFQYTTTTFINQLALGFPDTNIRQMVKYFLDDVELNESHLCIGAGGYKMPSSAQNLLEGSKNPNFLSLIKETEDANLSMILEYAEIIKKRGFKSAVLLGLSVAGNLKNIDLSPSVILAEHLNKLGIEVYIDDPFYNKESIGEILPFAKGIDIFKNRPKKMEVVFLMTSHNKYRYLTQSDLDSFGISSSYIIIDNTALFKDFKFSPHTVYHSIGDGNLGL